LGPSEKLAMGSVLLFVSYIVTDIFKDSIIRGMPLFESIGIFILVLGYGIGAFFIGMAIWDWKRDV